MNSQELIDSIAKKLQLQPKEVGPVVEAVFDTITAELTSGKEVKLAGFGIFSVINRKGRLGINPAKPGERMEIPSMNSPKFKAGIALKRAVKEKI